MMQVWTLRQTVLTEMAVWSWMQKALEAAREVKRLTAVRVENDKMRIRGELAAAREQTDRAVAGLFGVVDALNTLSPTDVTRSLAASLRQIEQRARQYYIAGTAAGQEPEPEPAATAATAATGATEATAAE